MKRRALVLVLAICCGATGLVGATGPAAAQEDRNPVLLTAGLLSPESVLHPLAERLRDDGWTVYTMALPGGGTGDIAQSAPAVAAKVDKIRAETGAARVDLVGHSEGGLVHRYYLTFLGGTDHVDRYVSLGTPQHGTYIANLVSFFAGCFFMVACQQMRIGSSFLATLNAGDITPGDVEYTAIATRQDELVRPVHHAFLDDTAQNVLVQDHCRFRVVGHIGLVFDGTVYGLVNSALESEEPSTTCLAL